MYLFSMIAVLLVVTGILSITTGQMNISIFIDSPSLRLLLFLFLAVMFASGYLKEFNRAFRLVWKGNANVSRSELKSSMDAVIFAIRTLLLSGFFITIVGFFVLASAAGGKNFPLDSLEKTLLCIAIEMLPFIYSLCFVIFLFPVWARLNHMYVDYMQENL